MLGALMCLTLAAGGWQANLIVYLIQEFNLKSIDATQVSNVVNGCTSLFPIIGAIVADSFFGCFPVILISSCISFLVIASLATVTSSTVVVYIGDSVSWGLGFGLSALVNLIGLVIFSSGIHFYRRDKPQGSPFVNIARVIVASIRKWNVKLSSRREDYQYRNDGEAKTTPAAPKKSFMKQSAMHNQGNNDVVVTMATCIALPIIDRILYPAWQKLTHKSPTPLQRLGIGHVLNIIGMVASALVESKHLKTAHGSMVPMLVMWLLPQLVLVGCGEAFHFPGQLQFCYQEFPASLHTTATAMVAAFYLSTALSDLVRRVTGWLPDDINEGRLDNVYCMVVVIGVLNFGYYLLCAKLYKGVEGSSSPVSQG
ncbi:hypothetical protein PS1_006344 [Malus domestica]